MAAANIPAIPTEDPMTAPEPTAAHHDPITAAVAAELEADRQETAKAHAVGDHEWCGIDCDAKIPTEQLRNFVVAKGYPGTAGALAELERRAAAHLPRSDRPTPDRAALRDRIAEAIATAEGWTWAHGTAFADINTPTVDTFRNLADAVLAVLPTPTSDALAAHAAVVGALADGMMP